MIGMPNPSSSAAVSCVRRVRRGCGSCGGGWPVAALLAVYITVSSLDGRAHERYSSRIDRSSAVVAARFAVDASPAYESAAPGCASAGPSARELLRNQTMQCDRTYFDVLPDSVTFRDINPSECPDILASIAAARDVPATKA